MLLNKMYSRLHTYILLLQQSTRSVNTAMNSLHKHTGYHTVKTVPQTTSLRVPSRINVLIYGKFAYRVSFSLWVSQNGRPISSLHIGLVGRLGLGVGVKTSLVTDSENDIVLMAPSSLDGTVAGEATVPS